MARACTDINWRYMGDSVPAFLTLAVMPFTYSIAYGLLSGLITYIILNTGAWVILKLSSGRIVPYEYEHKDYWTYKVRGGLLPGWLKRLARGKRDFWRDWDFDAEELNSRDSYAMSKKNPDRASGVSTGSQGEIGQAVIAPRTVMDGGLTGDMNWMPPNHMYNYRYDSDTDAVADPMETPMETLPDRLSLGSLPPE